MAETVEELEATRRDLDARYVELKATYARIGVRLHELDEAIANRRKREGLPPENPCSPCRGTGERPVYGGECVYCAGTREHNRGWRDR